MTLAHWQTLWKHLNGQTDPTPHYKALIALYSQPHRAYHTLAHVNDCLTQFAQVKHLAQEPNVIEMALWLHDVIYDPQASDNEAQSAAWGRDILKQGQIATTTTSTVSMLILDTQHTAIPPTPDGKLMVDIDLSILGRSPTIFDQYEAHIRQEYQWVPEEQYRLGRRQILESFLNRGQLYQTSFFYDQFETQARQNLQRSIERLKNPGASLPA